MGGGAGIQFELTLSAGAVLWQPKKRQFKILTPPTIEQFDACGYMDGMCGVRGELLKLEDFCIEPICPEDAKWLSKSGYSATDELSVYLPERNKAKAMIWAGWVRGTVEGIEGLSFNVDMEIDPGISVEAGFSIGLTDEFRDFYEDVFENRSTNTEDDMYDYKENYGVRN